MMNKFLCALGFIITLGQMHPIASWAEINLKRVEYELKHENKLASVKCEPKLIGEGSFGIVLKCINSPDLEKNEPFALKVSQIYESYEDRPSKYISGGNLREKFILEKARSSANLMYSMWSHVTSHHIYLAMPYCDASVANVLETKRLTEKLFLSFVEQLVNGVKEMHGVGILHRDIKPSNVMICQNNVIKISDFGASRLSIAVTDSNKSINPEVLTPIFKATKSASSHKRLKTEVKTTASNLTSHIAPLLTDGSDRTTLWYCPPDALLGNSSYGPQLDLWSLGCTISYLDTGDHLFQGLNREEVLVGIFEVLGTPNLLTNQYPTLTKLRNFSEKFPYFPKASWDDDGTLESYPLVKKLLSSVLQPEPIMRNSDGVMDEFKLSAISEWYIKKDRERTFQPQETPPEYPVNPEFPVASKIKWTDYTFALQHDQGEQISRHAFYLANEITHHVLSQDQAATVKNFQVTGAAILGIASALVDYSAMSVDETKRIGAGNFDLSDPFVSDHLSLLIRSETKRVLNLIEGFRPDMALPYYQLSRPSELSSRQYALSRILVDILTLGPSLGISAQNVATICSGLSQIVLNRDVDQSFDSQSPEEVHRVVSQLRTTLDTLDGFPSFFMEITSELHPDLLTALRTFLINSAPEPKTDVTVDLGETDINRRSSSVPAGFRPSGIVKIIFGSSAK